MRWRTLKISVLSVLVLSPLDSNKDAHSVCVASCCQGRPLGWSYAMELAEESALAEQLIAKRVLPIYGYQRGWPEWPVDSFITVLENECGTVAMLSSSKYEGYSDA